LHSCVNHSDDPNLLLCDDLKCSTITIKAGRNISEGEEVFLDYFHGIADPQERQECKTCYYIPS